jgi:YD repeat-containing protein
MTEVKNEDQLDEWFIYETILGKPSTTFYAYLVESYGEDFLLTGSLNPVLTTWDEYVYGQYGDLIQKVRFVKNSTGTEVSEERVANEYYANDYASWVLGLVKKQITQSTTKEGSLARTMSWEYDFTHRLPVREIVEPTGDQTVKLIRDYAYDDPYYNLTGITETGNNGSGSESRTTSFSWTYTGNEYSMTKTNPEGHTEIYDYEWSTGKVITYTDPNGLATEWYYDAFGRPEEVQRPDGTQTIFAYTQGGPVTGAVYSLSIQESGKAPVTVSFDKLDREIYRQTLAQNGQVIFKDIAYNVIGKVDTQSRFHFEGANPQITTYDYDVLGRVIQQNAFNTGVTTFSYNIDNKDNVQATNAKGQKVKQTNNVKGLLAEVVDNLNKVTTYTYTPFGDLQQVKDSSNNTTSLTYDIRGRRTRIADPDMGTWNYVYNAFGDLVSQTDARGLAAQMTYDKLSRIRTKMNGSETYVWSYDTAAGGIGKPSQVTGPNGFQETYTYDSLGRPVDAQTTVDGVAYTVTTGYDAYSRVSRIDYPASVGGSRFAVQYQYTANGYLEKVVDAASGTAFWTAGSRNALGQVTEETLGNGLKTTNSFDDATGRLLGIVTNNGASAQSLTYTYDTLGNLLSRKDNLKNLTESFTYDSLNHLTAVSGPQPKTFAYDFIGNITSKTGVGSYTYGGSRPHGVTAAGGVNYTYDANGNITGDSSGRSISFDGFNRPVGVAKTGASGSFVYDHDLCWGHI